jgi:hypothetical protein
LRIRCSHEAVLGRLFAVYSEAAPSCSAKTPSAGPISAEHSLGVVTSSSSQYSARIGVAAAVASDRRATAPAARVGALCQHPQLGAHGPLKVRVGPCETPNACHAHVWSLGHHPRQRTAPGSLQIAHAPPPPHGLVSRPHTPGRSRRQPSSGSSRRGGHVGRRS